MDKGGIAMKFKIKKKYLWEVLKLNNIVSEEGKIVIDNNGWSIVMSDPCHVMMGVFRLHKSAFEEYPAEIDTAIGVTYERINKFICNFKADDVIEITLDEDNKKYILSHDNIHDENNFEDYTDWIDLKVPELNATFEINNVSNRGLRTMLNIGDAKKSNVVEFRWINDKTFEMRTLIPGYGWDSYVKYHHGESDVVLYRFDGKNNDDSMISSRYSLEYLEVVSGAIGEHDVFTHIKFGIDYPAEILFECDNIYSMKYLLAPRIGGEY